MPRDARNFVLVAIETLSERIEGLSLESGEKD
jgi:hypothetical protein